jgi:terminase, large subunit
MDCLPALERLYHDTCKTYKSPPKLALSGWADEYTYLSAESSADTGKWRTTPYQKGIMDAISNQKIERVTVQKSARVGYTKMINHVIGYHAQHDPCPILVVQPTLDDARGYSKDEIAPMLRDTPVLNGVFSESKSKDSDNTILKKLFPGGQLLLIGANSARGFRRVSMRVVLFDETDGYPLSAGPEGDQIKLGIRRTEYYPNHKIIEGSTPTVTGASRIEKSFNAAQQKLYYYVPCPRCDTKQHLKWANITRDKDQPETAYYQCECCRQPISHDKKRWMVERDAWLDEQGQPLSPKTH